ncbi:hypothetical protein [Paracoccus mutanolyticus]|uniref:hypothetical protein n=1 Tax=Paracoccus mutanolyticus TaxID=1499308 RepID=UPI0021D5257C|nr:hypothetical protein [Paracoccus mutanolyticus]
MESEIFSKLGAAPVVTPFGEVFTAMSTGAVAGTDASTLTALGPSLLQRGRQVDENIRHARASAP